MKNWFPILASILALAVSCGKDNPDVPESPAPVLVSTSPQNGITDVTGRSLTAVFTFDQNIKCSPEAQAGIRVDGGATVENVNVFGTELSVVLAGLEAGKSYTLTLPSGTVAGFRKNQMESAAIIFTFTTRKAEPVDPDGWETAAAAARNMGTGWNLGNTLDSNSGSLDNMWIEAWTERKPSNYETAWGQPVATRDLIHMFKLEGFNCIRVPVTWYPHMGKLEVTVKKIDGEDRGVWDPATWTGYDVDPAWMARVKEVVDYVVDEDMYCILNVHHDTGAESAAWLRADPEVYGRQKERFCELWKQIATTFRGYDKHLLFESFNEMLDSKSTWNYSTSEAHQTINKYNADFVAAVRATGGNNAVRNLILNTYAASTDSRALSDFVLPQDSAKDHLMAEVHSYAPYLFAFDVSYGQKTSFDSSCEEEVKGIVDNLNKHFVSRGIPCVIGEYGCTARQSEIERAKQASCYVSNAAKYDIPCVYWMSLSDGEDRTVPKWTTPTIKTAILNAWNENHR